MNYKKEYERWLNSEFIDEKTKEELKELNEKEIEDRFYKKISFGTAGLRGIMGAGTNRINKYTIAEVTQGFVNAILKEDRKEIEKGVVIAYDVRHFSKEFAKLAAEVFAGNNIPVYLFDKIAPTPLLSFSVLELKTKAGVMITASHNSKDYNGYKAYWDEGSQILDEIGDRIVTGIEKISDYSEIKKIDFKEAKSKGLIKIVGSKLRKKYLNEIEKRKLTENIDKDVKIVYSPLNGTGNYFVQKILKMRGFKNVFIVKEEERPDPNFTTTNYPNPEDPSVFELSKKLGRKVDGDILITTDPDADRIGLKVKNTNGDYVFLNGNKIGVLLVDHILRSLKKENLLPKKGVIVKSIVTGDLSTKIAKKYGVEMKESLTGFKNLYEVANKFERENSDKEFIFAYEESIGYSYGTYVRDKDAVMSAMIIAEMAGACKKEEKTLLDRLEEIYEEFGYYKEELFSIEKEGREGQKIIKKIMDNFRANPINSIKGSRLIETKDFLKENDIGHSNVLIYKYLCGSWFALRPSGTEPKIKFYIYGIGDSEENSKKIIKDIKSKIIKKIED